MGCAGTYTQKAMVTHMLDTHTQAELWHWSIGYKRLQQFGGTESKCGMKSSQDESKMIHNQRKNSRLVNSK